MDACVTVQLFRECLAQPAGEQFGQFGPGFAALFPATGYRYSSGSLSLYGMYGRYWTAGPITTTLARNMSITSGQVSMVDNQYRPNAHVIRPILEQ